jgi:hypothetical protein
MAITTNMCNTFKEEMLKGVHDMSSDVLKLALFKEAPTGTYGENTTNYSEVTSASDETTGTNYTAGGQQLDTPTVTLIGDTAIVDFDDEVFNDVTIATDGCIIYNTSQGNAAVCVIDFGGTVSATAGDLTIEFPPANATDAVIRVY